MQHIDVLTSIPTSSYPSPPPSRSTSRSPLLFFGNNISMGGNANNVDGVGALNYQRAIDIARNTEGDLDPNVNEYLEKAVSDIWGRIQMQPDSYILTKDEFAVFNFYIRRFEGLPQAQQAVARYWQQASAPSISS
ncbi:hypothetical protein KC331_g3398 [Hortaea werneckii]|uniref:Uncharacterized protein n=1 Tax=Hortaea werneckii TaxID=91943 RepID=A0A3M7CPM8_HORWE|nr:hypothetical protein KC331_g3398 [Hortaea werneckii]KAI7719112.1 hypothetical protein KC353_g3246 [Hortaea werneckii]RMY54071.1 hypothetical protein D0865_04930 [Hortaea werneckii]